MIKSNKFSSLKTALIYGGLVTALSLSTAKPAQSQLLPQVWLTGGVKDEDISYGAGARVANFGVEVGTGEDGATGVDVLAFFGFPILSPYVGAGWYSGDDDFAYSGGVQYQPPGKVFFGAGYHSIRGINGQIGIKF